MVSVCLHKVKASPQHVMLDGALKVHGIRLLYAAHISYFLPNSLATVVMGNTMTSFGALLLLFSFTGAHKTAKQFAQVVAPSTGRIVVHVEHHLQGGSDMSLHKRCSKILHNYS